MTGTLTNLIVTSLPAPLYLFILHVLLCETISRDMGDTEKGGQDNGCK